MAKDADQISVRIDKRLKQAISELRRLSDDPIPTEPELFRQALWEKYERERKMPPRRKIE